MKLGFFRLTKLLIFANCLDLVAEKPLLTDLSFASDLLSSVAKLVIARLNGGKCMRSGSLRIITNFYTENKKLLAAETSFQKFLVSVMGSSQRSSVDSFFFFYFSVINGKPRNRAGGLKEKKYSETLKLTVGNNRRF